MSVKKVIRTSIDQAARIKELEQELDQCLTVHAKLNDENERLKDELEQVRQAAILAVYKFSRR